MTDRRGGWHPAPSVPRERPAGVVIGYLVMCDTWPHLASARAIPAAAAGAMIGPHPYAMPEKIPEMLAEARSEAFREAARAQAHADLDADKDDFWRVYWVAEVRRTTDG